jgi:hypothetical protein
MAASLKGEPLEIFNFVYFYIRHTANDTKLEFFQLICSSYKLLNTLGNMHIMQYWTGVNNPMMQYLYLNSLYSIASVESLAELLR